MRYLILSDIHSNLEAFQAVLEHARGKGYDRIAFLGDLVGYGASPNEVIDLLRSMATPHSIRGNHDKVVTLVENGEQFNIMARTSCEWTRANLEPANLDYLRGLVQGPLGVENGFHLSHGTPVDEDAYILTDLDAMEVFRQFPYRICFYGHSHIPMYFSLGGPNGLFWDAPTINQDEKVIELEPGVSYLLNPGSVGQPRDRNHKASYAIFENDEPGSLALYRVAYDVDRAQEKIVKAGMPRFLAERLGLGV